MPSLTPSINLRESESYVMRMFLRFIFSSVCVLTVCLVVATTAVGDPITYSLVTFGLPNHPGPVGELGSISFGGSNGEAIVTLTFQGDTSNVFAWSAGGTTGYEILAGTASVKVQNSSSGVVLGQGIFKPSDGIFVSMDNGNGGIGFGSNGALPSNPGFPGQPAYPFGAYLYDSDSFSPSLLQYNLKGNFDSGFLEGAGIVSAWSCVGFPTFPCQQPTLLATTAGNFELVQPHNYGGVGWYTFFRANVSSVPEPGTLMLLLNGMLSLIGRTLIRTLGSNRTMNSRIDPVQG